MIETAKCGRGEHSKEVMKTEYGRISEDEYVLTLEQIETFFAVGCVTIEDVLTETEVQQIENVFDRFLEGEIPVPGKDFCDMSKPFGIPYDEWSIVNCMLPTRYYPPLKNNIYERLTNSIAQQLFRHRKFKGKIESSPSSEDDQVSEKIDRCSVLVDMVIDYDQLLTKRPGKTDAVFAWHQDMAYWPGPKTLNVSNTDTCTFSLAIDDSTEENGCLRYIPFSGVSKKLRPHRPLYKARSSGGTSTSADREEGHALTVDVDETVETISYAPARRGSVTIHDEYVVHGSGGNKSPNKQRRTYVIAYRSQNIVDAERKIGFTHSHNDIVNWDTFLQDEEKDWANRNGNASEN